MSQVKRQLYHSLSENAGEAYDYQYQLQTIGMRVRKAVSEGYQRGDNMFVNSRMTQMMEQQQQQQAPTFQRVPMPSNVVVPPMLSNSSSSFGSSVEEWETNLDNRLQNIDSVLTNNKDSLSKRRFESVDNDW